MRIDAYSQISQVYGVTGKYKTSSVQRASQSDKVEISSIGKDMQVAKQALANASDVREDKVAALKAQLQNGTYNVSAESFADKLLAKYEEMYS